MKEPLEAGLTASLQGYWHWLHDEARTAGPQWAQRLAMNQPEIDHFKALGASDAQPWQARRIAPRPPGHAKDQAPSAPGAPVPQRALEAARQHNSDWHLFTYLADTVPRGQTGFLQDYPVAVKDMIAVQGMPLTAGSAALKPQAATASAPCIANLQARGAVMIGMANQHELAFGANSHNPTYGQVINPAAPDHIPGGSSGGSAAIVAAGITTGTIGTDTGGSVRLPAACCNVVGFKPGYDAISRDGARDVAPSLDHIGPIGQTVRDCALLFAGMMGEDQEPDWTLPSLKGLRIGVLGGYFTGILEDQVRQALERTRTALQHGGATLHDNVKIETAHMAPALQFMTISAEAAASNADLLHEAPELLSPEIRTRLEMALFIPAPWYVQAQRWRTLLVQDIENQFAHHDILVSATMRAPTPKVGQATVRIDNRDYPLHTAVTQLTTPFNLSGSPAISIPCGLARDGAPIGIQLIADRGNEWLLLAVAHQLETLIEGL